MTDESISEFAEEMLSLMDSPIEGESPEPPVLDHWDSDPEFPVGDWQYEVACGDTRQGYREWVSHRRDTLTQYNDEQELGG